jgi:hypothetical protein
MMWNTRISNKMNVGKPNEDALRGWLGNKYTRMLCVNVPAWFMFLCRQRLLCDQTLNTSSILHS